MYRHLLIILIFILIRYLLIYITSSSFLSPFLFSASSLFRRSKSYSSNYLFVVFSFSVSLGLRPIFIASKKSRISLTAFNVLNSLFFNLFLFIFKYLIIFFAKSLYSALFFFV